MTTPQQQAQQQQLAATLAELQAELTEALPLAANYQTMLLRWDITWQELEAARYAITRAKALQLVIGQLQNGTWGG